MTLPSPSELKKEFPPCPFVQIARDAAARIVKRQDPRMAAIVGPCSIHDLTAALEYAEKLKNLPIDDRFFPIMRVFVEKPRSVLGWKGIVYDPKLDGSNDIALGLRQARLVMREILKLELPIAVELLDPLVAPYFDDLITWGLIGARTSASQPHRQMASHLPFPIGFKNDCQGRFDEAVAGIISSRTPHSYIGVNENGFLSAIHSKGNPLSHMVLRGADTHTNYDAASIDQVLKTIDTSILIDCSHGNCNKDFRKQRQVLEAIVSSKNNAVCGFMLESHLFEGKQPMSHPLRYGVSITDGCLGWEETKKLLTTSF